MGPLRARTLDGGRVTLDEAALAALRAATRGELLAPGDAGYDAARAVWNGMIDRRPALILRCLGTADVLAGVRFAAERGLRLTVKGGGHNIAGLAVQDDALTLDLSPMRGVWVDPVARRAQAQAGCLLGDVDRETQLHGLATVLGFVSNTGIAGLTLGGGFGYLTRRYGWTCDNTVSMQVVTADGRLVRAAADENADLLWALRGGGGNFGVVTQFEYALHPVGPQVTAGAVAWRGEDAPAVLSLFQRIVREAPPEMTCVAVLRKAPPAPWLAPEVHGQLVVMLLVCHTGSLEAGAQRVASIKAFGAPVGDVLQARPYTSQQSLLDATQPAGRRYYWKSEYLPGVESGLLEGALAQARQIASPHSAILLFPLDGALREQPAGHSPAGNRDAALVVNIAGAWDDPADDADNIDWARATWRVLKPFSTGGTYVNFLTEEEGEDRIRAAYGEHHARLAELKRVWDPGNLFRANKNIAPAGG